MPAPRMVGNTQLIGQRKNLSTAAAVPSYAQLPVQDWWSWVGGVLELPITPDQPQIVVGREVDRKEKGHAAEHGREGRGGCN